MASLIIPIMVVWNILTWKKKQPILKMPSLVNFKTGSSFFGKTLSIALCISFIGNWFDYFVNC